MTTGQRKNARQEVVAGSAITVHGAASVPAFKQGRKTKTDPRGFSPKKQEARYQGELTHAMMTGKVNPDSETRVFKTPSGRYINAGGNHRTLAREVMGQGTPEHRIKVKSIDFEPRQSGYDRAAAAIRVHRLKSATKAAVKGKVKPVSPKARQTNHVLAAAADAGDAEQWANPPKMGTLGRQIMRATHQGTAVVGGLTAAGGAALATHGIRQLRSKKVSKSMNGHDAFQAEVVAKRDFSTKQREKLAAKGDALPDGSFPIKSKKDLANAEKLESKSKHPAEVAAYIERKKREMGGEKVSKSAFLDA